MSKDEMYFYQWLLIRESAIIKKMASSLAESMVREGMEPFLEVISKKGGQEIAEEIVGNPIFLEQIDEIFFSKGGEETPDWIKDKMEDD